MISLLAGIAVLGSLGALILLFYAKRRFTLAERTIVYLVCAFTAVINIMNLQAWWGLPSDSQVMEGWGDYLQILQPVLWGVFFYVVVQTKQTQQIKDSREQMRGIVEHMPVILHAYDENGNILAWNRHAEDVSGYTKEEMVGCKDAIKSIFPDPDYREQLLSECQNHGASFKHKIRPIRCKQRFERQIAWYNISERFPVEGWANWAIGLDMTEQIVAQKELEHMATHDELTGLANRALFRDRLMQALNAAQRSNQCGALILLDLDHFKMVNDSHGHPVGDKLLCEIGQRLQKCVKSTDTLARLGGDEFIILLENLSRSEDASLVAERIRAAISHTPFYLFGNEIRVRCSMGVTFYPEDDVRIDELIKNVDLALYAAKDSGRSSCNFYSRTMHKKLRWQHRVSEKMRQALDDEEFSLYYQPQIAVNGHQVVGMEALLRWDAYDEVPLSPAAFIPIAENMGLMSNIGKWVVRQVCQQVSKWHAEDLDVPIAINLSSVQLYQNNLVDFLSAAVDEFQINPENIEFEITESSVMRNMDSAIQTMRQLVSKGFSISLDDFGTGYSSLSYLKRFPVSKLKIDQSFIRGIETDRVDASIVRSVIDLGHSLDMNVLAEGVETQGQVNRLVDDGCDIIQGYYFSQPLAESAIRRYMSGVSLH